MRDFYYEFVDLYSGEFFQLLGKPLGGVVKNKAFSLDPLIATGEFIKSSTVNVLYSKILLNYPSNLFYKPST